jgi:hypothetical protein
MDLARTHKVLYFQSAEAVVIVRLKVLHKTHLKKGMTSNDRQESLQAFSSCLDNFVREPIGEYLARKRRDIHPSRFALENVAEGFKIRVSSTHK